MHHFFLSENGACGHLRRLEREIGRHHIVCMLARGRQIGRPHLAVLIYCLHALFLGVEDASRVRILQHSLVRRYRRHLHRLLALLLREVAAARLVQKQLLALRLHHRAIADVG